MGYVKIPVPLGIGIVTGRYIKFQYSRVECLNLAEIKVFSSKDGKNIITPNTRVTKSSDYGDDMYPVGNFVDGNAYNFVHTSCNDKPWIQVDLGSMINIYKVVIYNRVDCCQNRILGAALQIMRDDNVVIYTSNAVNSTNRTYSWFPPNPDIRVDLPEDAPPPPPQKATFYYHCWYDGPSVQLGPGNYDAGQMGLPPYSLSSLRVPAGLTVVLYNEAGFRGRSITVTGDNACLVYSGFNDATASIKIY